MESTLLGLSFGLAAGLSPGPLLTLVVQTSLARGFAAGVRVAVAPILTDAPVIALSLVLVDSLPTGFLRGLAVFGGLFIAYLGVSALRHPVDSEPEAPRSSAGNDILRACLVNLLNPHPWMFWVAVGGPILAGSWRDSPADALGFLATFYALLVGLKILFAGLASQGREAMGSRGHRIAIQFSGALLVALGLVFLYRGLTGRL